jgi:hypothetical protein
VHKTFGDCALPVAAARIWNGHPVDVLSLPSLPTSRREDGVISALLRPRAGPTNQQHDNTPPALQFPANDSVGMMMMMMI